MNTSKLTIIAGVRRFFLYHASAYVQYPLITPRSAVFGITRKCNSRCSYCPIWKLNSTNLEQPSLDEAKEALRQLALLGVRKVTISGGEPLLWPHLPELVRYGAKEQGLIINVLTNGLLLNGERVYTLVEAGVSVIGLSLDSLRPEVYFALRGVALEKIDRARRELEQIARKGIAKVGLTAVVTMLNLPDLLEVAEYAKQHNMGLSLQPYNPVHGFERPDLLPNEETFPRLKQAIEKVIEAKAKGFPILNSTHYLKMIPLFMKDRNSVKKGICIAGYTSVNIDTSLNVLPCWNLPPVGNLRQCSLKEIWYSEAFKKARLRMRRLQCPGCLLLCHHEYQYG